VNGGGAVYFSDGERTIVTYSLSGVARPITGTLRARARRGQRSVSPDNDDGQLTLRLKCGCHLPFRVDGFEKSIIDSSEESEIYGTGPLRAGEGVAAHEHDRS